MKKKKSFEKKKEISPINLSIISPKKKDFIESFIHNVEKSRIKKSEEKNLSLNNLNIDKKEERYKNKLNV